MKERILTPPQISLIDNPISGSVFLEGPSGTGKTTAGVRRLMHLLEKGTPGGSILLIIPQRTLATPYYDALNRAEIPPGGMVSVLTIGGLAKRMVELFWPLAAEPAGFARPDRPPVFLTLETAQYFMARLVRPLLTQGYFESLSVDRNRLYSQVVDNLNKAAVVGFPYTEIGARLKSAWMGEISQARVYDDAQDCAMRFREYCLQHNLLDFSLQLEVFLKTLWPNPIVREHLVNTYRHLLVDNVEEDTPAAHDLLCDWLPDFDSALIIFDQEAGYRSFLGADPNSAYALKGLCSQKIAFTHSFVTTPALRALGVSLAQALERPEPIGGGMRVSLTQQELKEVLVFEDHRYYPQMLDWVAEQISSLVNHEGIPPGEIVVLAPFLSDALRFSLINRLERLGIPSRSHRPSRALREEPATGCLLTLAALAHPVWGLRPSRFDVAYGLIQAIEDLDLVRAQLLTGIVYRAQQGTPQLSSFERIKPDVQERITYALGRRYERLRIWLEEYRQGPPEEIDYFFSRLFGEVLSQPGFGFHRNYTAGEVAANLVDSARKFRWAVAGIGQASDSQQPDGKPLGQEYLEMVQDGVVAAQYLRSWQIQPEDAVLLAPAYTFLLANRPVDVQFWLDISSKGWFERLYQPLTHPFVLSRRWPKGAVWTFEAETEANQESIYRLALGLVRRCRRRIYLGLSELSEQGFEYQGPFLKTIQRVLRNTNR